jgi:hypothetical protein
MSEFGCCQKFVCGIDCPKVGPVATFRSLLPFLVCFYVISTSHRQTRCLKHVGFLQPAFTAGAGGRGGGSILTKVQLPLCSIFLNTIHACPAVLWLPFCVQSIDKTGLNVSWGVPFVVAAVAMVAAGVVIGCKTIKGEQMLISYLHTAAAYGLEWVGGWVGRGTCQSSTRLWVSAAASAASWACMLVLGMNCSRSGRCCGHGGCRTWHWRTVS